MSKILEWILDIIAAMAIIFFAVIIYFGLKTELIIKSVDKDCMKDFLSSSKTNGYFTSEDYERLIEMLSLTRVLYDIKFEHQYKIFEPEYRMRTLEEILAAQMAAYKGENIYHYKEISTDKPVVADPIDNSGLSLNTETNESILASDIPSTADPGHIHADDCYDGHVHKGTPGPFMIPHAHTTSCGKYTTAIGYAMHCYNCDKDYPGWYSWYHREPSGVLVWDGSDMYRYKKCPYCSDTWVAQGSEIHNYAHVCGYDIDVNNDRYLDDTPIGVVENYPSSYPPATVGKATYSNGCYTYHVHKGASTIYNNYIASAVTQPMAGTYFDLFNNGLINFCDIPRYWYLGVDSLGYGYPGFGVCYRADHSNGGFTFTYMYYKKSQYGSWLSENPGFPTVLSEAEFNTKYRGKYEFINAWNKIGTLGYLTPDNCDFCVNANLVDSIKLCDFTTYNKWYLACGKDGNGHLACNQLVKSIIPTNPVQAVYKGEPLITTARATFIDGSKKAVLCTTSFVTNTPVTNADVVISYTNIKGEALTAHMTVTVVPRTKTCSYGHVYNLNPDGSDPGCPYCNAWVESIRIQHPVTLNMTITIGTTLEENGVVLVAKYLDGHMETITSGYVDNLDSGYLGTKLVTIGYKGVKASIMVTTVSKKIICAICGHDYELYPDSSDPGCPYCQSKIPVFTGNVLEYENKNYMESILEDLYEDGIYQMNKGDKLTVQIQNKSSTITHSLLKKIYFSLPKQWLILKDSTRIKEY